MKNLKTSESGKMHIALFSIFAVGLIAALPIRCYQLFNIIDSATGFYTQKSLTVIALNIILTAVIVLSIVLAYLGKKTVSRPLGRNIPLAAATFLFAFSLIFDGVNKLFEGLMNGLHFSQAFVLAQGGFALLSSLFFIIVGISFAVGTDTFVRRGILAITPVFWAVFRILQRFTIAIDFKNVSEILFELAMLCFTMLFFVAFARVYAGTSGEAMSWRIFAFGVPTALLAFVCSVPRYLVKFVGLPEKLVKDSPPVFADFCLAVFIVAVLIAFVSNRRDAELLPEESGNNEEECPNEEQHEETEVLSAEPLHEGGEADETFDVSEYASYDEEN